MLHVLAYLAAVILANLAVSHFGPPASIPSAFLLIGATLTVRDVLHDKYGARGALSVVLLAAAISAVVGSAQVALASVVAFAASETADTLAYHGLRTRPWLQRANASNVVAAAVDSLLFPTIAFGGLLWPVVAGQFVAKVAGGALWSLLLRRRTVVAAAALLVCAGQLEAQGKPPKIVVQAQAGTIHYSFKDYRPVANGGINAILFLPRRWSLLAVISQDATRKARPVGVIALQYRLWSK